MSDIIFWSLVSIGILVLFVMCFAPGRCLKNKEGYSVGSQSRTKFGSPEYMYDEGTFDGDYYDDNPHRYPVPYSYTTAYYDFLRLKQLPPGVAYSNPSWGA
jgi:hypothetical protein